MQAKELNKARTTFIDTILKHQHDGRMYAEAHLLRSDDGGTVTGRFSYSNANLQQEHLWCMVKLVHVRSLFVPEVDEQWGAFDYSSQEPRLVVHYASLLKFNGAEQFAEEYNKDKFTDEINMADIVGTQKTSKRYKFRIVLRYGK